jgi:hypothetical protein
MRNPSFLISFLKKSSGMEHFSLDFQKNHEKWTIPNDLSGKTISNGAFLISNGQKTLGMEHC